MNSNMEIQREAIIEIVGTQHEGRAVNHNPLFLQQGLILKHQNDNSHDHNAVLLLTEDGKELGFLPKGYASLYAPAIDSGRYSFTIEVVKSEPDPERPILIVKITSELKNHSEEEIENDILGFVQNIVNGYAQRTTEYLSFIYSVTVNVDDLILALNKARLIQKLHSCSCNIIESRAIKQNSDKYTPLNKESLTKHLSDLKADVSDILKIIQKAYNESLDIDDEEEYHRVQSEIRERRKKFRSYYDLLTSLLDAVTSYVNVSIKTITTVSEIHESEQEKPVVSIINTTAEAIPVVSESVQTVTMQPEPETKTSDSSQLTDQRFFNWLVSEGDTSYYDAKQCIYNIHSIEKLYQTLFGVRRNIIGTESINSAKEMIEALIQRSEYIDANGRRHNSFNTSLCKFTQFADISIEGLSAKPDIKKKQPVASSETYDLKIIDLDDPDLCINHKPCALILNGTKYSVNGWRELYTKFLILIYTDKEYRTKLKVLIGKPIFGANMDFADETLLHFLRTPIWISNGFFANGNLSDGDIIKRVNYILELCAIDKDHMVIEYSTQEQTDEVVNLNDSNATTTVSADRASSEVISDKAEEETINEQTELPISAQISDQSETTDSDNEDVLAFTKFVPDNDKPFVLKDAVIEILLTEAPEIVKYHEHKDGISSKNLRGLIKEYYGKSIGLFEISKLLMLDKTFLPVGKGCYIVNETAIPHSEPEIVEKDEPVEFVAEPIPTPVSMTNYEAPMVAAPYKAMTEPMPTAATQADMHEETTDYDIVETENEKKLTIEPIIAVIKDNHDNLQYEDGFGAYEVKTLLSQKGYTNLSEDEIEALMSACSQLQEIEDGYYNLAEVEDNVKTTVDVSDSIGSITEDTVDEVAESPLSTSVTDEPQEVDNDIRCIVLRINGSLIRAYDCSDALNKVCEFSINCKPFRMARIAGQDIQIHGNSVFYRKSVPVDGYNKLSNGLQIIAIDTLSDLQTITSAVLKYCQIDNDMITIISK